MTTDWTLNLHPYELKGEILPLVHQVTVGHRQCCPVQSLNVSGGMTELTI